MGVAFELLSSGLFECRKSADDSAPSKLGKFFVFVHWKIFFYALLNFQIIFDK